VEFIQSEFPRRGELLPYFYFYKNKWFDNAVIIHDSVFFQKKVNFHKIYQPVLPLWHFSNPSLKHENRAISMGLALHLRNNRMVQRDLMMVGGQYVNFWSGNNTLQWSGCFGVQSFINHNFLVQIQNKYNIFSLLKYVRTRVDRCCLERIMGVIFFIENPNLRKTPSLFGEIMAYYKWEYTFSEYCSDCINHTKKQELSSLPIVKVWTGR